MLVLFLLLLFVNELWFEACLHNLLYSTCVHTLWDDQSIYKLSEVCSLANVLSVCFTLHSISVLPSTSCSSIKLTAHCLFSNKWQTKFQSSWWRKWNIEQDIFSSNWIRPNQRTVVMFLQVAGCAIRQSGEWTFNIDLSGGRKFVSRKNVASLK